MDGHASISRRLAASRLRPDNDGVDMGPLFTSIFGLRAPVIAQAPQGLLAIHGVYAYGNRFVRMAELLPETTVVAPDLRGFGRSPKRGPYTTDQHVRDLGTLLRRMSPRTLVLGHSYGGLVAWELARANHDQLAGLVLVDPAIAMDKDDARREQVAESSQLLSHRSRPDFPSHQARTPYGDGHDGSHEHDCHQQTGKETR